MLTYAEFRADARDGDILLCKDRSFVGVVIRVLTAESYNHVAMLVWMGDGLMVAEMREALGFRITPASQWFARRTGEAVWGWAPRRGSDVILERVIATRADNPRYSYPTLLRVWWSQLLNRPGRGSFVCSTWVQRVWEQAGYGRFDRLADPGDLAAHCSRLVPVTTRVNFCDQKCGARPPAGGV